MASSSVWAQLATSQQVAYGVPFIDPNTLVPALDNGASGLLVNFGYTLNSSVFPGGGGLHIGTFGNFGGVNSLNLGGQGDSYVPILNQIPATVGGVPGFRVSSSNGSRQIPSVSLDLDLLGEFAGYGLLGATSPLAWTKLAGISYYASGASATNTGGKMKFGTKADAGAYTDWIELTNTGTFAPLVASTPAAPTVPSAVRLGRAGYGWGSLNLDYSITATVGAVTINKPVGRAIIALGAKAVVVTNKLVTANSIVLAQLAQVDATLTTVLNVVAGAGSFTINGNVNATADCAVNFFVIGTDS